MAAVLGGAQDLPGRQPRASPGAQPPSSTCWTSSPTPPGPGLHVGHPLGYIASDIMARFLRMRGYNVLHPMGWDAFGLPAEQYAVETGVHPRVTTQKNIATYTAAAQDDSACRTTGTASSPPATRSTTAGRSGSS